MLSHPLISVKNRHCFYKDQWLLFEIIVKLSVIFQKYGELGVVEADEQGRAEFRIENGRMKIWEVIGRSLVIHQQDPISAPAEWKR